MVDAARKAILADLAVRARLEMVALAFWAHAASAAPMAGSLNDGHIRSPSDLALQIAPDNVDTMFLYQPLLSVLAGNVNILRVSSRESDALDLLLRLLNEALHPCQRMCAPVCLSCAIRQKSRSTMRFAPMPMYG